MYCLKTGGASYLKLEKKGATTFSMLNLIHCKQWGQWSNLVTNLQYEHDELLLTWMVLAVITTT